MDYLMLVVLAFLSFLLIIIVLLQRGRGGGLAGALGGAGGQSAFGTKAGDVFTKITIGLVVIWVLVAGISIQMLSGTTGSGYDGGTDVPDSVSNSDGEDEAGPNDAPAIGTEPDALKGPDMKAPGSTGTEKPADEKKTEADSEKPVTTDDKKTEEKKPESTTEPVKTETKKVEPVKTEPKKEEPAKPETPETKTEKPAEPPK